MQLFLELEADVVNEIAHDESLSAAKISTVTFEVKDMRFFHFEYIANKSNIVFLPDVYMCVSIHMSMFLKTTTTQRETLSALVELVYSDYIEDTLDFFISVLSSFDAVSGAQMNSQFYAFRSVSLSDINFECVTEYNDNDGTLFSLLYLGPCATHTALLSNLHGSK